MSGEGRGAVYKVIWGWSHGATARDCVECVCGIRVAHNMSLVGHENASYLATQQKKKKTPWTNGAIGENYRLVCSSRFPRFYCLHGLGSFNFTLLAKSGGLGIL